MKQTERRGLQRGKGGLRREAGRGREMRGGGGRGKGRTEKTNGEEEEEVAKNVVEKHQEKNRNKERERRYWRTERSGQTLTVTLCFIESYISVERVTQSSRGRGGWQDMRRKEKARHVSADAGGGGDGWGREKQPGDFPEENRCASLLAEFKVLECDWLCILMGTEGVRCLLEGHWISVWSLQDT